MLHKLTSRHITIGLLLILMGLFILSSRMEDKLDNTRDNLEIESNSKIARVPDSKAMMDKMMSGLLKSEQEIIRKKMRSIEAGDRTTMMMRMSAMSLPQKKAAVRKLSQMMGIPSSHKSNTNERPRYQRYKRN